MCHHVFTILAMMKLIALFSSGYEKNHTNMKKKVTKTLGSCALIVVPLYCKQKNNNNNKTITQ